MQKELVTYKCDICGNIVTLEHNGGGTLVCCGKPMRKLKANTVDASLEKHVPVVTVKNNKIVVQIGSVLHPMEDAHYIQWIALVSENRVQRVELLPHTNPTTEFEFVEDGIVYEYCNLHGLWQTTF